MLNRVQSNRPTAATVHQDISAFHDGMFCGRCCLDVESSSSGDEDFGSDVYMLSDISEREDVPFGAPWNEHKDTSESLNVSLTIEEPARQDNDIIDGHISQGDRPISPFAELDNHGLTTGSGVDTVAPLRTEKKARQRSRSRSHFVRSSSRRRGSQSQDVTETSYLTLGFSSNKNTTAKIAAKPNFDKEKFVRWLASLPDKFKAPLSENRQARLEKLCRRPNARPLTVESQRIGHFLSSLPEEPSEYEITHGSHSELIIEGLDRSKRQIWPTFYPQYTVQSLSQEQLPTTSDFLTEDADTEQFSGVTRSRLVHYASDNALCSALATSRQTLREATGDLKAFAATAKLLKGKGPKIATSERLDGDSTVVVKDSGIQLLDMADADPKHLNRRREIQAPDVGQHSRCTFAKSISPLLE